MKKNIFLLFLILNIACYSQSNINMSISQLIAKIEMDTSYIPIIDTIEQKIPCFGLPYDLELKKKEYSYDTLYCTGILWCCSSVCEINFYKILEYKERWVDDSNMNTLVYKQKKVKIINNYFYFTEEQFKEKKWHIKPEYIIKIFEEKNYKNE